MGEADLMDGWVVVALVCRCCWPPVFQPHQPGGAPRARNTHTFDVHTSSRQRAPDKKKGRIDVCVRGNGRLGFGQEEIPTRCGKTGPPRDGAAVHGRSAGGLG